MSARSEELPRSSARTNGASALPAGTVGTRRSSIETIDRYYRRKRAPASFPAGGRQALCQDHLGDGPGLDGTVRRRTIRVEEPMEPDPPVIAWTRRLLKLPPASGERFPEEWKIVARRIEDARREAERLTRLQRSGTILGPLHGIPIGVKDIFNTAGVETACGSRIMAGFVPPADATAVARLRAAGAIILGKTHTTEFASFDPSPARNPWALTHTPGGSSSGSGAALAARMCQGALGSQTSGSIIRPAAFCGVVGLEPTFGRVSRHGVHPLAWTLDHPGPMARTVRDAALLLDAVAGPDPHDPAPCSAPAPPPHAALLAEAGTDDRPAAALRVGVPDRYFTDGLDEEAEALFRSALRALEALGCGVREIRLPDEFEAGMDAHELIHNAEAAAVHVDTYRVRPGDYGSRLRAIIETGLQIPAPTYVRAQQVRTI